MVSYQIKFDFLQNILAYQLLIFIFFYWELAVLVFIRFRSLIFMLTSKASRILLSGDHSQRHELVEAEGNSSDESACDKYLALTAELFTSQCMIGNLTLFNVLIMSLLLLDFLAVASDSSLLLCSLLRDVRLLLLWQWISLPCFVTSSGYV